MALIPKIWNILRKTVPVPIRHALIKIIPIPDIPAEPGQSLIPEDRLKVVLDLLDRALPVDGDIIECGVYRGGSLRLIAELARKKAPEKTVYGLDTFEGHPFEDPDKMVGKKKFHYTGRFHDTGMALVKKVLKKHQLRNVRLLKGRFDQSFPKLKSKKFCFAMADADLYQSTVDCITFMKPRMTKGGIIFFDDYNDPTCPGVAQAVKELIGTKGVTELSTYQAYWVKK